MRKTGEAAKFVFIRIPMGVLGGTQLALGNRVIRDLWNSIHAISCPSCKKAPLIAQMDEGVPGETGVHYPWLCSGCGFALLAPDDRSAVRQIALSIKQQAMVEQLDQATLAERDLRARRFIMESRFFWAIAAIAFAWFVYNIASGARLIYSAYFLSPALACSALGLKASYRAWQLQTGTLFTEGAFLRFLRQERWFR